ncbi:Fatty acid desaturase A [Dorcoceras hygrometricum]|uniref:Fatty acid desaturase A n=1 Tax=Dorcoceras hygrometricum TaxID=472368 RepID=A0A2Z7ABW2_9LAMI|nr:Fatty acid desaturase A [Dorcoceras hygrometricum]
MAESVQKNSASETISSKHFYDEESWKTPSSSERAWFASGCITLLITVANFLMIISRQSTSWTEPIAAAVAGYVLGDLGTGIYHWAIDNYGSAATPVFGSQIEGFLRHHEHPSAITKRHIATNLYAGAAGFTILVLPMNIFCTNPNLLAFAAAFLGCGMFCQQLHAWSHTPKGRLPRLVVALQDAGVILPRAEHAAHHHVPFDSHYCIVTGVWNRFLDKFKIFWAMEMILFFIFGVRPRSWSDFMNSK